MAKALFLYHVRRFLFKDSGLQAVPITGINHDAVGLGIRLGHVLNFLAVLCDYLYNGQAELPGKLKVPVVMGRHAHDGAGTVISQYVIRQPDRRLCTV